MSKKIFEIVNPRGELIKPNTANERTYERQWDKCFTCQEVKSEALEFPAKKSTHANKA